MTASSNEVFVIAIPCSSFNHILAEHLKQTPEELIKKSLKPILADDGEGITVTHKQQTMSPFLNGIRAMLASVNLVHK